MRKLQLLAICGLTSFLTACGSDADPGKGFFKGEPIAPAPEGGTSEYPKFDPVAYPAGPYGTEKGSVIPNLEFYGWASPADPAINYDTALFEKVSLADWYDPDGTKGWKLILVTVNAVWCTVCQADYAEMKKDGTYARYQPKGVQFMCDLYEDGANPPGPAKPSDLHNWGSKYAVAFPMALDPGFKFAGFFTAEAVPENLIVDARTMVILDKLLGGGIVDNLLPLIDKHLEQ